MSKTCDDAVAMEERNVLRGLSQEDAVGVRHTFEAVHAWMSRDPNYLLVRTQVDRLAEVRSLVRLEIAPALGGRYTSSWFIDTGGNVLELTTGFESERVRVGLVSRAQWDDLIGILATPQAGLDSSMVSTSVMDSPIYLLCTRINRHTTARLVLANPREVSNVLAIKSLLELSQF